MPSPNAHFPRPQSRAGAFPFARGRRDTAQRILPPTTLLAVLAPSLVLVLALVLTGGCRAKPTQDQCNALADHLAELIQGARLENANKAQNFVKEERDRFVLTCVSEGSFNTVDCMLKASSWEALQAECSP